jgi:hypothetical protein
MLYDVGQWTDARPDDGIHWHCWGLRYSVPSSMILSLHVHKSARRLLRRIEAKRRNCTIFLTLQATLASSRSGPFGYKEIGGDRVAKSRYSDVRWPCRSTIAKAGSIDLILHRLRLPVDQVATEQAGTPCRLHKLKV